MNPAASPETLYNFIRQMIAGADETEDRSGRTPLQAVADYLSGLNFDDPALQNYFNIASRLVGEVAQLSEAETTGLVKFILTVRSSPPALPAAAQRVLRTRLQSVGAASKRADILWLLCRLGERSLPKDIAQEKFVRDARPWIWFDLAIRSKSSVAIAALPELAKNQGFFAAMLSRIPRIWKLTDEEEFVAFTTALRDQLDDTQRTQLTDYLGSFEIPAPDAEADNEARFDYFAGEVSARVSQTSSLVLAGAGA